MKDVDKAIKRAEKPQEEARNKEREGTSADAHGSDSHSQRSADHRARCSRTCPECACRRCRRRAQGEKKQGKFHIEYINGKPVTVIDTVVSGVRQGPAPERGLRAHREEHRLRMGEPEAGLHAAHPRYREEGARSDGDATRPRPTHAAAAARPAAAHPAHRRAARRQDRRGAADPRAHVASRSASR